MAQTAKTKQVEATSFKVGYTNIVMGQSYEVVPKYDADAPNGFQQFGTTKLMTKEIAETHQILFDESMGIWDTGFDEISLSNIDIPDEEKTALVNIYNSVIKKKYEETFGKDLSSKDTPDSFWRTYKFNIHNGKTFDTKNLKDLLDLFMALKHFKVCEKGEKSYLSRTAMYNITNKEQVMTIAQSRVKDKAEAMFTYMTLDKGDKETMYTVLEWLQFTNVRSSDPQTLMGTVLAFLEKDVTNVENFLAAYKQTQSESGLEEMEAFSMVMKLYNRKVISYKRKEYYMNDEVIGNSPKDIAKRALSNGALMTSIVDAHEKISA